MTAIIDAAGWTLVHFLWQGAAIAAVAALGLRLLRRGSPQARYALACVALAAMVASPLVTAARLSSPADAGVATVRRQLLLRERPSGAKAGVTLRFVGIRRRSAAPPITGASSGAAPVSGAAWIPTLVGAWVAGVCLLLARLAAGLWRVRALRRAGRALPPSSWQVTCDRLAHRLGVRRPVRVVDASFVDGPVVIGWLRPVVLLPIAALTGLTPSQVEAILAHELAHVRRHDAVVNACQTVAETLLFYHPAVWWLSSRVRAEREHCCDDIALDMSGDPLAYAEALAELESWRVGHVPLAMAATGGPLLSRVARVLARPPRPARLGTATTAALVLSFVVAAGALQYLVARQPAVAADAAAPPSARAWRMLFDHPSGQMVIRGFTGRDLVRYAYQLPVSRIVGGPAWLDTDAFELATTLDHVPAADETPALVRSLLEERFGLAVHESTISVPVLALEIARRDGALGPNLRPATGECFDQEAWVAAGAPRLSHALGEHTQNCGVWDSGIDFERVRRISMDELAASMRRRFAPALPLDVINRTGLPGVFDLSLEYFRPAAALMAAAPSLRLPLQATGFKSVQETLEEQLGLTLVRATADAPAIVIDHIEMSIP